MTSSEVLPPPVRRSPVQVAMVLRQSLRAGFADFRMMYSLRSWAASWLVRMVMQVLFFALMGALVRDAGAVRFLLVGHAMLLACISALLSIPSSVWERRAGTLPLLLASPWPVGLVMVGRNLHWIAEGIVTSTVALLVLGPAFGVRVGPAQLLPVALAVVTVAVTGYCFAMFLAALVLERGSLRNMTISLSYIGMMAICGVTVPVTYWPPAVQAVAQAIPLTHALAGLRAVLDGAGPGAWAPELAVAGLVGAGWLAAAFAAFAAVLARARRRGTIEMTV